MSNRSFEQLAYEFPEIWDEDWFQKEDHERVRKLATLIPHGTETLLDVGCGNGLFLNFLQSDKSKQFSRLAGVDRSEAALIHVKTEKKLADITNLPFDDASFDTVTCCEVLEHLPLSIYEKARAELARVARQAIIIGVPYKQDLEASLCKCPSCLTRFNPDFHMRSYDEKTLSVLFDEYAFKLTRTDYLGESTIRYDQEYRTRLRRLFSKSQPSFPSFTICPVCGFREQVRLVADLANLKRAKLVGAQGPKVERSRSALRRFIASVLPIKTSYRWITTTYARNSSS